MVQYLSHIRFNLAAALSKDFFDVMLCLFFLFFLPGSSAILRKGGASRTRWPISKHLSEMVSLRLERFPYPPRCDIVWAALEG